MAELIDARQSARNCGRSRVQTIAVTATRGFGRASVPSFCSFSGAMSGGQLGTAIRAGSIGTLGGPAPRWYRPTVISVAFDAWPLAGAGAYRGVGTYARHLLTGLARHEGLDVAALALASTELPPGVRRVPIRRVAPGRWAQWGQDVLLPGDLR